MKTKDLVAALHEADPSGELECCLGNHDIHFVDTEPAYWDGCLQVLQRDQAKSGYNITGAEYRSNGTKVVIHGLSVMNAILNNPEIPITYETDYCRRNYEAPVEKERQTVREINKQLKQGNI